jgi:hypothetical protein
MSSYTPGEKITYNPWLSATLISCVEDPSREVPGKAIITSDGETIPINI